MTQLSLPLDEPRHRKGRAEPASIPERFAEFDRAHPEVYDLFKKLARRLSVAGHARGSADAIVQVIRWQYALRGPRVDGFKINDHFTALYARKLAAECPAEFGAFFEFRVRKGG